MRCAFIGLGVMGFPMAGHLVAAGHDVTVHNRTRARAEEWIARHGGAAAPTPAAAQAEAGNVRLLRGPWNEAFMDELCSFPAGSHDDQVDAFADALNELALAPRPITISPLRI